MSTEAPRAPVPPRPTTPPALAAELPGAHGPVAGPQQRDAAAAHTTAPAVPARPAMPPPAAGAGVSPAGGVRRADARPAPVETTVRLRAVPAASGPVPVARAGAYAGGCRPPGHPFPETPMETTTRLRPVGPRHRARTAAAAACVVLGLGLIGGAVTGAWLTGDSSAEPGATSAYATGRSAWHSVPVDTLFPRTLKGDGAGPGATNRAWTRLAVAADSDCAGGLDPLLLKTLRPAGCERMVRATYTDATRSSVTTVGMVFTEADAGAMQALSTRFTGQRLGERADLMPRTFPAKGTVAAAFGDRQRASWTVRVLTEIPVVVFAVSGFADGRTVADPQPVADATAGGATTAVAQAGLGHEAAGVADRVERGLRRTVTDLTEQPE